MRTSMLRSVSLLALASCAAASQAVVAYSNKPAGDYFLSGYEVSPSQSIGYLFTSTATGALAGFDVAINNYQTVGPAPFTLSLYADAGGTLGSLLGTFSATSSGNPIIATTSGYDAVAASGVGLTSGTSYWLVASSASSLYWSVTDTFATQPGAVSNGGTNYVYQTLLSGAFSVNVDPISPAVPGPMAALPFALMALRRRKRA